MTKLVWFLVIISFLGVLTCSFLTRIKNRMVPSPYATYASLIPHSYRIGFTNLDKEISINELALQGTIPAWLSGTLLRNGPAKFSTATSYVSNWFDGLAMIHAFSFDQGKVSYINKFLKTNDYQHMQKTGNMNYQGFLQDPCKSIFKKFFTLLIPNSMKEESLPNANVNITRYADRFVALTETPLPIEFDAQTLETVGGLWYADQLPHRDIQDTAHPHYDTVLKEHIGYYTTFGPTSSVHLFSIKQGSITRNEIASMTVKEPSYMHSFAITERYAILSMIPLVAKPLDFLLKQQAFIKNFAWKPELGTKFVVIDRIKNIIVGSYLTDSFFAFHHVNAFERDDSIIIDIITYPDAKIIFEADMINLLAGHTNLAQTIQETKLIRFTIDLVKENVTRYSISDTLIELPTINPSHNGKEYRYMYAIGQQHKNYTPYVSDMLVKINVQSGEIKQWSQPGCHPGEPVFIVSPDAQHEDDGVIVSVVLDINKETSFLLVLDAQTFIELGRAEVPHHIPYGIHGTYVANNNQKVLDQQL